MVLPGLVGENWLGPGWAGQSELGGYPPGKGSGTGGHGHRGSCFDTGFPLVRAGIIWARGGVHKEEGAGENITRGVIIIIYYVGLSSLFKGGDTQRGVSA